MRLVKKAKLDTKTYEITSPSLTAYKKSIEPLDSAASAARIMLIAVTIVGGIALLALIACAAIGGRRDEIGMAMITGWSIQGPLMAVHAGNVHDDGSGLDCRFGCGRAVGEAIGTAWAGGQAVSMTSASVWNVIWYGLGACLVLGIVHSRAWPAST